MGPYEVIEQVGVGGMATVYRARQVSIDRDVALKLISGERERSADAIQRFQREARLIARLEHVHILPVYDFDGAHAPPYIVMRYIDGGTLKEILTQGLLPLDEVTYIMGQICSAVEYANRQGIIHRDLKPSNILVDREGNTYVADFGIARHESTRRNGDSITGTGLAVGTPEYMSPEQAQDNESLRSTDIYSLGVMLFQMLTGKLPYLDTSALGIMMKHISDPIPSVLDIRPELPAALDVVIQRTMAKDPDDRYDLATTVSNELAEIITGGVNRQPSTLRLAAGTSMIRRLGKHFSDTGSSGKTPTEHNKIVTVVNVSAADYALLVEENAGTEALTQAMSQLLAEWTALIDNANGTILSRSETDMLAVWGAEIAREDDAEQAIRTALQMQEKLVEIGADYLEADDEESLPLNIGINSGMVLLKPATNEITGTWTASGATINIANRLMQNAVGSILVTYNTLRQVMGVFHQFEDVPLRLRGRKEVLATYNITGIKPRAFRLQMRDIEGIETRMVGRRTELEHLQHAFDDAVEEKETRIVTIVGEAGSGKSRLLFECNKWLETQPIRFRIFDGRATSNMMERPYSLIRDIISNRFQILDNDPIEDIKEKLEAGVAELTETDNKEMAHFIGYLCGFDLSDSPYIKGILEDPQQIRQLGRQNFVRLITTVAGDLAPTVMRLEDIHYADNASLDLLTELFTRDDELHLMAICVARPTLYDRREDWGQGHDSYSLLELQPLNKRDSRQLAHELLQKIDHIPKTLRDLLVDRAEGNPFYMEELVRMLLDDRVILRESDDIWKFEENRLVALDVPTSLHGLLEARMDTLLYLEKLTLQRASVVGRVFHDTALDAMNRIDEYKVDNLPEILNTLLKREIILRRETTAFDGSVEYIFASNMFRDAVANALLERQTRMYNRAAAEWLDDIAGNRRDEYLPQIANYYARAGETKHAAQYWLEAGEVALKLGESKQALSFFQQAYTYLPTHVNLLRQMAETVYSLEGFDAAQPYLEDAERYAESDTEKLQVMVSRNNILGRARLWEEAIDANQAALPLAQQVEDPHLLINILYSLARGQLYQGDMAQVPVNLDAAMELVDQQDHLYAHQELDILNIYILYYSFTGDFAESRSYCQQMLELARKVGNREREATALNLMAEALKHIDREAHFEEICSLYESALAIIYDLGHVERTIVYELNLAMQYIYESDSAHARPRLKKALEIALATQSWSLVSISFIEYGMLMLSEGQIERGLALFGVIKQTPAWDVEVEHELQLTFKQFNIGADVIEAGMAAGQDLDYDEELEKIIADLEGREI